MAKKIKTVKVKVYLEEGTRKYKLPLPLKKFINDGGLIYKKVKGLNEYRLIKINRSNSYRIVRGFSGKPKILTD